MKKYYLLMALLITCFTATITSQAQGIYNLWGTAAGGGQDDKGVLYTTKSDGTGQLIKKHFDVLNPGDPSGSNTPIQYGGKLYCLLAKGGVTDEGIIATYDPATGTYEKKANLADIGAEGTATYSLTELNNKLYGVTNGLTTANKGLLFEFDPATNALTVKYTFPAGSTTPPAGKLLAMNNKLYGITINNISTGYIYEFNPANNIFSKKLDLDENVTGAFYNAAFEVMDAKLWAVTYYGGVQGPAVISYDPATNIFSKKALLSSIGASDPDVELLFYNNRLYGTTSGGGAFGKGMLYEFNPYNNTLTKKVDFKANTVVSSGPLISYNNKLYGHSYEGGVDNNGVIYSFDPASNILDLVISFGTSSGKRGCGALLWLGTKLYGFTTSGAPYDGGCLFEYDPAGDSYDMKVNFGGPGLYIPGGRLVYYNNKIYGTTSQGGSEGKGGIFEYNLVTDMYTIKRSMSETDGYFYDAGGLILYNNKLYGVTPLGGALGHGSLLEYDPATNTLIKRHDFTGADGSSPQCPLTVFNGKLYGTCMKGSTNDMGNLFQYDPVTHVYTEKVVFNPSFGSTPQSQLIEYNGKLYGATTGGGTYDDGVIFEYNPLANGYIKKAEFQQGVTEQWPTGQMCIYKDKLYGTSWANGSLISTIFCYDLINGTLTKKVEVDSYEEGRYTLGGLTLLNNKMYGVTLLGGDLRFGGVLFEYNPENNIYTRKTNFISYNGRFPRRCTPLPVPAPVAPGSPGSCTNTTTVSIQTTSSHDWIPFTDNQGRAVAEINANGNVLGNVTVRYFVNDGNVRQDTKGTFYLDRNLTITVANQPTTPVSIRLYIRKSEFDFLKGTAGSGVTVPADISIFHNNDFCKAEVDGKATKVHTTVANWGMDYVYMADVSSFSSFYFATNTALTLPIHLESFTGKSQATGNQLTWKASCTDPVEFTIERSVDGIQFTAIGTMSATQQDCANPFNFNDAAWLPGKNYYRLNMKEQGNITLSKIVLLDRTAGQQLQVKVLPNPVTGPQAQLQVTSPVAGTLELFVTDMAGKTFPGRKLQMMAGTQNYSLAVGSLPAGVYCVRYYDGRAWQSVKFIKQ